MMKRHAPLVAVLLLAAVPQSLSAREWHAFKSGSWREIAGSRAGQPLIVHIWAMSCGPCREELPRWGNYLAAHPGVRVVFINWDRAQPREAAIDHELAAAGLKDAEHWRISDAFEEKLRFEIDKGWLGEMPYTILAGASGQTAISGAANFDALADWLKQQNRH